MRFIHTSDWHIGRTIRGQERWDEVHSLLEEIASFVETQKVELVALSGDVFDVLTPPAEAERVVYDFFCRMNLLKVPVVVIAGNHDSPQRFDSRAGLFSIAGVYVAGRASKDAVFRPIVRSGAEVIVGALPFLSEKSVIKGIDYMEKSETELKGGYTDKIEAMIRALSQNFKPESINILMTHLYFEGSIPSHTERQIDLTNAYAVPAQAIPPHLNYFAVGHIHKQQKIKRTAVPSYYSGSIMKLDFGEEKDQKGFLLVDAKPGVPSNVEFVELSSVRNLMTFESPFDELEKRADEINASVGPKGYAKIRVHHKEPIMRLGEAIQTLIPRAVDWELLSLPQISESRRPVDQKLLANPVEMFKSYFQEEVGREPTEDVLKALKSLYDETSLDPE